MNNEQELKDLVKLKYAEIAGQSREQNASSCCGGGSCSTEVYNIMAEDYSIIDGYKEEADLGLGCGLPTQFARIRPGDTVIDLGSGAGNDAFIAAHETGPDGEVIGIDFTSAMLEKARMNALQRGATNVEFLEGDIERMPVASDTADVVVSNCVLNLVPNKKAVFDEIFRVLKPGGHFSISDIVLRGELPDQIRSAAEFYAGCVSGAIQKAEYMLLIDEAGFASVIIQKEREIMVPDDILLQHLSTDQLREFRMSDSGIYSVTVFASKPLSTRVV